MGKSRVCKKLLIAANAYVWYSVSLQLKNEILLPVAKTHFGIERWYANYASGNKFAPPRSAFAPTKYAASFATRLNF